MRDPDLNQFNLDEDGEHDNADYSECINTFQLEESNDED